MALDIVRRHRLWEFFLVEKLQFGWDEVHEIAEELEHVGSKNSLKNWTSSLIIPVSTLHGDPIPDSNGKMSLLAQVSLTEFDFNKTAQVTSVGGQSGGITEMLKHRNIKIGTQLEIKRRFDFDKSLEIK